MLVDMNSILHPAKEQGYGVGFFNAVNVEMARAVIETAEEMKTREPDMKKEFRCKVVLAGSENDDPDFTKLVESCGARVVVDRYCYGAVESRQIIELPEGVDPVYAIAKHYLHTSNCPRFMPQDEMRARKKRIAELAKEYHADGVIIASNKFCEYWSYERVIDTVNWIAEHANYKPTEDTEVVPGKWYFDANHVQVTPAPDANPYALGLYEIDEINATISNYVATHIAVDDLGMTIQTDGVKTKVRIDGGGVKLINQYGVTIATYSDAITLGDETGMHVTLSPGDSTASPPVLPELGFWQGSTKVAYINSETLMITKAEIETSLRIGKFVWKVQSTNRVSLVYSP